MVLREDGLLRGSVSGGCIEDDLIAKMANGEFQGSSVFTMSYGVLAEEARRFGLPCGGTLELVVEPNPDAAALAQLSVLLSQRRRVLRCLRLSDSSVELKAIDHGGEMAWDGERLCTFHGPAFRLMLIGAGQISQFLAPMATAVGYEVSVCDPRIEYTQEWSMSDVTLISDMPDDAVVNMNVDAHCAIVALTHDPKLDDMALLEALKSPAFYVGALGSKRNQEKRKSRLFEHFDLTQAQLARLYGPVGLAIGSRTPPEIAISILAEITAVKNGVLSRT
jgi:xanthine dehydrogenase accessory factor